MATTDAAAKAATKTAATKAAATAAKQAAHSSKNVEKAAELGTKALLQSIKPGTPFLLGAGVTAVGMFAHSKVKTILAKRKLDKEIAEATSGPHESRESRA